MTNTEATEPPGREQVVFRTTRGNDITLAVVGLILGALLFFEGTYAVLLPGYRHDLAGARGGSLFLLIFDLFGPIPLSLGFGICAFYAICTGTGGAWRLVDRRAAVTADRAGIHFHPSVCGRPVSWREVRDVKSTDGRPGQIRIDLRRRFWSPLAGSTGKSIRLNRRALGISVREARTMVKAMKGLAPDQFRRRPSSRTPRTRKG